MIESAGDVSIERLPADVDIYVMRVHDHGPCYGDPFKAVCFLQHDYVNKTVAIKAGLSSVDNGFSPKIVRGILDWIWTKLEPDMIIWERFGPSGNRKVVLKRRVDAAD